MTGAERQALLASASNYAARVMAAGSELRLAAGELAPSAFREAGRLGLLGLQVDRRWGGLELPFSAKAQAAEVLAAEDFGLAMAVLNSHNAAHRIALDADAEVARIFVPALLSGERIGCTALTEWQAGSDFAAIQTVARRTGGVWRLDGGKAWITNAAAADTFIVFAQTGEIGSVGGIASYLIDGRRPGFVRGEILAPVGQETCGAASFRLEGYEAAETEMLAAPGEAFRKVLTEINGARIYVAAMCCGMLAAAIAEAARFGSDRKVFGRALSAQQGWRWVVAEAEADLAAARALVNEAALALDAGSDVQLLAAKTKVMATRMAERHIPAISHAMGAEGLRPHRRSARHAGAVRLVSLVDGSTEILLERIAKLSLQA